MRNKPQCARQPRVGILDYLQKKLPSNRSKPVSVHFDVLSARNMEEPGIVDHI